MMRGKMGLYQQKWPNESIRSPHINLSRFSVLKRKSILYNKNLLHNVHFKRLQRPSHKFSFIRKRNYSRYPMKTVKFEGRSLMLWGIHKN